MHSHSASLHLIITIDPFKKWGVDFMEIPLASFDDHKYIFVIFVYMTKWTEAMPTFVNDGKMKLIFIFNHILLGLTYLKR
jgi:hypothetical protein